MSWQLVGNVAGKDADISQIQALQAEIADLRAELLSVKTAAAPEFKALIIDIVEARPRPRDGKDGLDGKSIDPVEVEALVSRKIHEAVSAIPKPRDGENGKDGFGIKSAVVNNDGHLLLTMSNDEVRNLGCIMGQKGRDGLPAIGRPGADGTSVTIDDVRPMIFSEIAKSVAAIPKPVNGKDGKDGLSFTDLEIVLDETKGMLFRMANGDRQIERAFPVPFFAGIWESRAYPAGAIVKSAKGLWLAQTATKAQPDQPTVDSRAWRLIMRDARDGKQGPAGPRGKSWDEDH